MTDATTEAVERVFRDEYGRVIATLIRQVGDFQLAEDVIQEALLTALAIWPERGVPRNPGAWITTTARRKAIDRLRRASNLERKRRDLEYLVELDQNLQEEPDMREDGTVADDQLRLIFTCCHPALATEAQVALTLKTLGGLTTEEIARAFLVAEPTMAQRLVRAKRKIREANIPYRVPAGEQLAARLEAVLSVVYLVFNEGYMATQGDVIVRTSLAVEAIRLGRLLVELMPQEPEAKGLTALMLLHDSRRDARFVAGDLVLLEDQERTRWDRAEIEEGFALLDLAVKQRRPDRYQLEAAIAALHARADRAEDTNWAEIAFLYNELLRLHPSPVVALNRAVAVAMASGPAAGLALLDGLAEPLDRYHLYHAARARLLEMSGESESARDAYLRALDLVTNTVERRFLENRLEHLA
jgi:RNA polymerase sigma-70 factor (ECF subfamily)